MERRPGDGLNLDCLVTEAIRDNDPNRVVETSHPHVSLMVCAVIEGRLDLVQSLFTAGAVMTADELARVIDWWTDVETVELLLRWGTPLNESCLHGAVYHGKWDIVFLLLDNGADLKTTYSVTYFGRLVKTVFSRTDLSLLHAAVWQGQPNAVRQLLKRGIPVDERDSDGFTPLMKGCHFHQKRLSGAGRDTETVFWLLESGANPDAVTPQGETPLLLCLGERFEGLYFDHRIHIAQLLLKYGANPNVVSPHGTTPLMFAARDNCPQLILSLLQGGAKPEITSPTGKTALDVSVKWRSKEAEDLLKTFNSVRTPDASG